MSENKTNCFVISGIIAVPQELPIGEAIEEISMLIEYSFEDKWENQIVFIPLN